MTAQFADVLLHRGRRLDLCDNPLESWLRRLPRSRRPAFATSCTALRRGYIATWEVIDRRLHLVALKGLVGTGAEAALVDLAGAFPRLPAPIPATWVSGTLRCPEGRLRRYVHQGYASEYERDRLFTFRDGALEREELVYDPPSKRVREVAGDGNLVVDGEVAAASGPAALSVAPALPSSTPDADFEGGEGWCVAGYLTHPPRLVDPG